MIISLAMSTDSQQQPPFSARKELKKELNLFPEMPVEILSRLPIKSLTRFKCVSKSWLSTIDLNLRSRTHPSYMLGFFYVRLLGNPIQNNLFQRLQNVQHNSHINDKIIDTSLQFLPFCFNCNIIDSCNGLLLCRSMPLSSCTNSLFYFVCNPATERWDRLPNIPYKSRDFARLAFDPYLSCHYKVLWVEHCDTHSEFNIFSSENRDYGWQKLLSLQRIIKLDTYFRCGGMFSKGVLYMTSCGANGGHIVRYRLLQGTCTTIRLPSGYKPYDRKPFVGLLAGSVCCAELTTSRLRIWTLVEHDSDDVKSLWILKSNITVQESDALSPALAFHPLAEVVFVQANQGFWSYDLSRGGEKVNIGGPKSVQDEREVGLALPYTPCYVDVLEKMENKNLTALCGLCFLGFCCFLIYLCIRLMKWYAVMFFMIVFCLCRCLADC